MVQNTSHSGQLIDGDDEIWIRNNNANDLRSKNFKILCSMMQSRRKLFRSGAAIDY